jgi:hypothetical protein
MKDETGRKCSMHDDMTNAYRISARKPEGNRLFRPRQRWRYNIKMNLREVQCEDVDWIQVAQDMVQY